MRRTGFEFQDQIHQILMPGASEARTGLIGDACAGATGVGRQGWWLAANTRSDLGTRERDVAVPSLFQGREEGGGAAEIWWLLLRSKSVAVAFTLRGLLAAGCGC